MMKPHQLLVPVVCLVLGSPAWSAAGQGPDATQEGRFRFGPLAVTPKLAIQNLGVDTNVFHSAAVPVRDLTATVTPGADAWLRIGRVLFTSKTITDFVFYQKAASQRSVNFGEDWRIDVDLQFARPRMAGVYLNTRQRPNDEIDERVQQKRVSGGAGVTIPAGAWLRFDVDAKRTRYDFSQGVYGDVSTALALNRDSDDVSVAAQFELTPLTSLTLRIESIRDRFVFASERDSDSVRVMPGLTFKPSAFISGSAFVGYRRMTTLSAAEPDFSGVVAAVELKYVALDMLRVTGQVKRDVDYSLDLGEPFYVSSSVGLEVMQAIGLNWDVVGRTRVASLAYVAAAPGLAGRVDQIRVIGVGAGRLVGENLRIGIDLNYIRRTSAIPSRAFEGLRFGGSFTYGY